MPRGVAQRCLFSPRHKFSLRAPVSELRQGHWLVVMYHENTSSKPVYYFILYSFGQRSNYISIKFPLQKQSENPKCATNLIIYYSWLLFEVCWGFETVKSQSTVDGHGTLDFTSSHLKSWSVVHVFQNYPNTPTSTQFHVCLTRSPVSESRRVGWLAVVCC